MNDCLKEPALFVGDISDEIDLSLPPTSGEDYIKRVVIEAKRCESVVVAEIDESRLKKPTVNVKTKIAKDLIVFEQLGGCVEAPASLRPTPQWQQCQITDFSDLRLRIAGLKNQIKNENRRWEHPATTLPDIDDQSGWINFFTATEPNDESPTNPPTLGTIFSMNHPTVEQALEYLVEFIETESEIRSNLGKWVYALLAVIELPLNPDACSCLRTLARACSTIRANTDPANDHRVNASNLFICLVARYFRQHDLADS